MAAALSQLDAIVARSLELPVRLLAFLGALDLRAPGLSVDSGRCMVCRVTLEAVSRMWYDGVPGVECSTMMVSETMIHEVKHFQLCSVQRQHAHERGEARREYKEMNKESRVNAYQEV